MRGLQNSQNSRVLVQPDRYPRYTKLVPWRTQPFHIRPPHSFTATHRMTTAVGGLSISIAGKIGSLLSEYRTLYLLLSMQKNKKTVVEIGKEKTENPSVSRKILHAHAVRDHFH